MPDNATIHSPGSPTSTSSVPWWNDLSPAVAAELDLNSVERIPPEHFDVVVIGAGVAGLSAALSASQMGARVLVLEKEGRIGHGATGRNAGILSAGINMSMAELPGNSEEAAFWPETTQVLLSLVAEAARPGSLLKARLTGALSLAETASAARRLAREARARVALGLHAEIWTAAQVAGTTDGRLDVPSVVSALWLPTEGRVHPLTLLAHLARQVRDAGGRLAGCAQVRDYQAGHANGQPDWQLTLTNGQRITTRGLIEATGPTAKPNARIYALAFAADLPDHFPLFWDAAPYTYADFRAGDGRLTISGGRYGRAGVTKRDAFYHKRLADAAQHWLPELADSEPVATWAVDLDVAADMIPHLRELGNVRSGLAIVGLGALGVLPGIILGQRAGRTLMEQLT
ncbi:MAG TPA: FAD-dependent oxidoreductase [Ktedonobacteraceae bacterium]|nr:FAD-dependent oxidoreductase [Ktedonobacteraceae bacterium]